MFTSFLLYLIIYFITFSNIFILHNLKQLMGSEKFEITKNKNEYISVLDQYLFYDIVENVDNFYNLDKDIENIIVFIDNSETSKFNLLLLYDLFPNSNKIAICLDKNDLNIFKLCNELNFKYYNKFNEYNESQVKNKKEFILEYCKLCDVKYCFMNVDSNQVMTMILDGIYNNDYKNDISNIEISTEDDINVYTYFK